jgi:hypothetical protein
LKPSPPHTRREKREERDYSSLLLLRFWFCAQQEHLGSLFLFWLDAKLFFILKLHQFLYGKSVKMMPMMPYGGMRRSSSSFSANYRAAFGADRLRL